MSENWHHFGQSRYDQHQQFPQSWGNVERNGDPTSGSYYEQPHGAQYHPPPPAFEERFCYGGSSEVNGVGRTMAPTKSYQPPLQQSQQQYPQYQQYGYTGQGVDRYQRPEDFNPYGRHQHDQQISSPRMCFGRQSDPMNGQNYCQSYGTLAHPSQYQESQSLQIPVRATQEKKKSMRELLMPGIEVYLSSSSPQSSLNQQRASYGSSHYESPSYSQSCQQHYDQFHQGQSSMQECWPTQEPPVQNTPFNDQLSYMTSILEKHLEKMDRLNDNVSNYEGELRRDSYTCEAKEPKIERNDLAEENCRARIDDEELLSTEMTLQNNVVDRDIPDQSPVLHGASEQNREIFTEDVEEPVVAENEKPSSCTNKLGQGKEGKGDLCKEEDHQSMRDYVELSVETQHLPCPLAREDDYEDEFSTENGTKVVYLENVEVVEFIIEDHLRGGKEESNKVRLLNETRPSESNFERQTEPKSVPQKEGRIRALLKALSKLQLRPLAEHLFYHRPLIPEGEEHFRPKTSTEASFPRCA